MDISLIIPTYNRKKLLDRAIRSALSQGFLEILVVDDFSSDGTEEYIKNQEYFDKIRYFKKDKNSGVNSVRNFGIKRISGEWIVFLDDDDEFLPGVLSVVEKKLDEMPANFNVAYFNSLIDDSKEGVFTGGFQFKEGEIFYDPSYEETFFKFNLKRDCKPVFRRILFDNKKYLFNESVNGFESYTMNLIARDGKGIRYFNEKMVLVHFDDSLSHLSNSAPKKKPWPLLILHLKQIPEHFLVYVENPIMFLRKLSVIIKLFTRTVWSKIF